MIEGLLSSFWGIITGLYAVLIASFTLIFWSVVFLICWAALLVFFLLTVAFVGEAKDWLKGRSK